MKIRMLGPEQRVNGKEVKVGDVVDADNASHARWLIRAGLAAPVGDETEKTEKAGKAEKGGAK